MIKAANPIWENSNDFFSPFIELLGGGAGINLNVVVVLFQSCEVSPYGVRECAQYPVQKPVKKCAEVPQQTCIRSRLKHKCRRVTQNVCRQHCHVQQNSFPSRK